MNVNQVAFLTTTGLAAATAWSAWSAATTTATVAIVAYSILAVTAGAVSIAAITAWMHEGNHTVNDYFERMKHHAGVAVAGMYQLIAQSLVQTLIDALLINLRRRLTGADQVVEHRYV